MQNYTQSHQGYQRPGSTASFATGQGPPPPPYGGANTGYQTASPTTNSQWAPPPPPTASQWNQPQQQGTGGYNPNTYGPMPGAVNSYGQNQQQNQQPPPPPPKPEGYPVVAQQQTTQSWGQQNTGFAPQAQGGYPQSQQHQQAGGFQHAQQPYNAAAPPPPSQTPGGSYFPPAAPGRPGSIYGADQVGTYSSPATAPAQQPPSTIMSPNEQQPAYIPPSLTGQGVQSYMPQNTNPMPGVYVPPPPDIPAWQQANHAPMQGGSKFKYTKPLVDPSFQGYQQPMQQMQPQGQFGQQPMHQPQAPPVPPHPQQQQPQPGTQQPYGQPTHGHLPHHTHMQAGQFVQPSQPLVQQVQQQAQQQNTYQQPLQQQQQSIPPQQAQQYPQSQVQPLQNQQIQGNQWQQTPAWQPGHQSQGSFPGQQLPQGQDIQAPKPLGRTNTTPSFVADASPQSTPVSPVHNRYSISFASNNAQTGLGRTSSVSSIALGQLRNQQKPSSPAPPPPKLPTPPPPRDDASRFSALGTGGPSDWEHFGDEDNEVDDEALFGTPAQLDSVELPAPHSNQPPSVEEWPTPEGKHAQPAPLNAGIHRRDTYQPTPPPQANTGFVMDDGNWGAATKTPTQASGNWNTQAPSQQHIAELKAKDDALELLRSTSEKEKADLRSEIEKLRTDLRIENEKLKTDLNVEIEKLKSEVETTKSRATEEQTMLRNTLNGQIETMRNESDEAKSNEREATIKEREAIIADLREKLTAEQSKELPKPTPIDLLPDIDPWYAGSLERFMHMLRHEAAESQVQNKLNIFKAFLKSESGIRGVEYYDAPPPAPPVVPEPQPIQPNQEVVGLSGGISTASANKPVMQIQVPPQPNAEDDDDDDDIIYTPGGRPRPKQKPSFQSAAVVTPQQPFSVPSGPDYSPAPSNQSTASTNIPTPVSSTDDESNTTPVQSPPEPAQKYIAYVPPASSSVPIDNTHRQSLSYATQPFNPAVSNPSAGKHDEIFFGEPTSSKPTSRPTTSPSNLSDVPVPAPLSFASQRSVAPAASKKEPLEVLNDLLPPKIIIEHTNTRLDDIRARNEALNKTDFKFIAELTENWEKSATLARKKRDVDRRKRQEESEARNDELFNNDEISYADIGAIEDEFKERERELKAKEDRDEYKSYVEEVFDKVYDRLQDDIKSLMDLYIEAETLLHTSITGIPALSAIPPDDVTVTGMNLELLRTINSFIEIRHEIVVNTVAERDRRYKKTEIQPLYAAGNITKMKTVEKHFENAEKAAVLRAKSDKAQRVGELVRVAEEAVIRAITQEQGEIDAVIAAIKNLPDRSDSDSSEASLEIQRPEVLARARKTLDLLTISSKDLLELFNKLEIDLNDAVLQAEIAQARAEGAEAKRITELEREMRDGEEKLKEEFERKVGVLEQGTTGLEVLVKEKGGVGGGEGGSSGGQTVGGAAPVLSEEEEKKKRMKAALEEAKRRNGEL
ncbi:hypothetical protein B0J11DRAFT_480799 [Dendryphion nanum]|uniref:Uncharacterized protein n=1 Tax=Dendryphion nanum TaxID=256645 RepID=A0A9P9E403_9PLEO|nr:hypothetical protein B0J11DRAFT_480799 [Dendryphion nanum]